MTHTKGNVIQYNEYYPFGMQTANSWTRENTTGNNFLGNGGTELNTTSNVYDLFYRNYDPALGRMNQVDPMATKYASLTPYNYAFNDPVFFNDPMGDDPYSTFAKEYYQDSQKDMYGDLWKDRMRDLGRVGDDDLFSMNGRGSTSSAMSDPGPKIYSKWCGCDVSAFEVLRQNPRDQNAEFRRAALIAVNSYLNKGIRQDATKVVKNDVARNSMEDTEVFTSDKIGVMELLALWDKLHNNSKFGGIPDKFSNYVSAAKIGGQVVQGKYWLAAQNGTQFGISLAFQYEYLIMVGVIQLTQMDAFQHKVLEGGLNTYMSADSNAKMWINIYQGMKDKESDSAKASLKNANDWILRREAAEKTTMSAFNRLIRPD